MLALVATGYQSLHSVRLSHLISGYSNTTQKWKKGVKCQRNDNDSTWFKMCEAEV